jgi:hypothetical protein
MTTAVTPEIKQDHPESQEWPTLARDLADTTHEGRADWFDPSAQDRLRAHRARSALESILTPTDRGE